jgi:GNAT superfamily N-acetyltransferase
VPITIRRPDNPRDLKAVHDLFVDYAESLGFDLCFQNFGQELAELPGKYAEPGGCLLLAMVDDEPAGCVAMRPLENDTCEMKRLYVRPSCRGLRLGRSLAERIVSEARALGYKRMRLDTVPSLMGNAVSLYATLGFTPIEPYCVNPIEGAMFLELRLDT